MGAFLVKPAGDRADSQVMRILAASLALVTVLAVSAAEAANPRSERVRLRPADVSLAKQAVLRQDDVGPGWSRVPTEKRSDGQFACASFKPDFSAFTVTGQASASFRSTPPGAQIDSTVAVFRTKAQAVGDFRLGARPQLARCLAEELRRAFRRYPDGIEGKLLSSKMVPAPKLGERSAAYAVTARLSGNGNSLPVFVDVIAVQQGRSIAALVFTGVGSRLPSRQYYAASVSDRLR
jgi:hypothetical protein